jgi:hypothetical protein
LARLKSFKITHNLYTRFKDDIEIAIESLVIGCILVDDKIVIDENKKLVDETEVEVK